MDRGVIVGGGLIAASFLVAVLLNRSAQEEAVPPQAVREPPARVCDEAVQRQPGVAPASDSADKDCDRPTDKSPQPMIAQP